MEIFNTVLIVIGPFSLCLSYRMGFRSPLDAISLYKLSGKFQKQASPFWLDITICCLGPPFGAKLAIN